MLKRIYRDYRECVNHEGRCWFFPDEVQQVPEWERWMRESMETMDIRIFVTGSSSHLLSRDIGTKLTGRNIFLEVFPLSFREFLRFNGNEISGELE